MLHFLRQILLEVPEILKKQDQRQRVHTPGLRPNLWYGTGNTTWVKMVQAGNHYQSRVNPQIVVLLMQVCLH